jgi:hypothetical protein
MRRRHGHWRIPAFVLAIPDQGKAFLDRQML